MYFRCVLAVSAALTLLVSGDIAQDKVDGANLPGWNKPLPSNHYSGYIEVNATNGKRLHYW